MCGIFGVICAKSGPADHELVRRLTHSLLLQSETRGSEAAGIAAHDGQQITVLKQGGRASELVANPKLTALLDGAFARHTGQAIVVMGHSRLATNGAQSNVDNNQPVIAGGIVALHNGIVVNDRALAARHASRPRRGELDSEVLALVLRDHLDATGSLDAAAVATFGELEGSASIAVLFEDLSSVLLATNTGSLFQVTTADGSLTAFASERFILQRVLEAHVTPTLEGVTIEQVPAYRGVVVDLTSMARRELTLTESPPPAPAAAASRRIEIVDLSPRPENLARCTKCILPSTYPFIELDAAGVCRYCRTWKKIAVLGEQALVDAVAPYRSKDGSPDVILAFSGGRDSSYGLHYVKKHLGMNPVAFTYDWGMVTDLARRNQARLCGKLGVEHIIRSADITAKRRYVRKNVEAWLKRPEIGMVTLFMAGDKEFYSHARKLREETGIKLVIFCTGNMIEDAPYKTGLMGVPQDDHGNVLTKMSTRNKAGMLWYYAKNYALNPSYLNESFFDTFNAYWQTFVVKDDFLYLFKYLEWKEDVIVNTIRREYDWEVATDTTSTWRIGDGTAAFYNYIYQTIAGFTEDEVMLANMVREGYLTREQALARAIEYSKPRWPSIAEYASLIGFSVEEALQVINAAPKLY